MGAICEVLSRCNTDAKKLSILFADSYPWQTDSKAQQSDGALFELPEDAHDCDVNSVQYSLACDEEGSISHTLEDHHKRTEPWRQEMSALASNLAQSRWLGKAQLASSLAQFRRLQWWAAPSTCGSGFALDQFLLEWLVEGLEGACGVEHGVEGTRHRMGKKGQAGWRKSLTQSGLAGEGPGNQVGVASACLESLIASNILAADSLLGLTEPNTNSSMHGAELYGVAFVPATKPRRAGKQPKPRPKNATSALLKSILTYLAACSNSTLLESPPPVQHLSSLAILAATALDDLSSSQSHLPPNIRHTSASETLPSLARIFPDAATLKAFLKFLSHLSKLAVEWNQGHVTDTSGSEFDPGHRTGRGGKSRWRCYESDGPEPPYSNGQSTGRASVPGEVGKWRRGMAHRRSGFGSTRGGGCA